MKSLRYKSTGVLLWASLTVFSQVPDKPEDVKPLSVGQSLPGITVTSLEGNPVNIRDIMEKKPTVLVFYRGGWCPYCTNHLAELAEIEQQILDAGYQIVAVSPDSPENLSQTLDKKGIRYTLLSDPRAELIKAMGLAYKATFLFENIRSKGATGDKLDVMPVPSLFIVDQSGTILYRYFNPDYKVRMSGEELVGILPKFTSQTE